MVTNNTSNQSSHKHSQTHHIDDFTSNFSQCVLLEQDEASRPSNNPYITPHTTFKQQYHMNQKLNSFILRETGEASWDDNNDQENYHNWNSENNNDNNGNNTIIIDEIDFNDQEYPSDVLNYTLTSTLPINDFNLAPSFQQSYTSMSNTMYRPQHDQQIYSTRFNTMNSFGDSNSPQLHTLIHQENIELLPGIYSNNNPHDLGSAPTTPTFIPTQSPTLEMSLFQPNQLVQQGSLNTVFHALDANNNNNNATINNNTPTTMYNDNNNNNTNNNNSIIPLDLTNITGYDNNQSNNPFFNTTSINTNNHHNNNNNNNNQQFFVSIPVQHSYPFDNTANTTSHQQTIHNQNDNTNSLNQFNNNVLISGRVSPSPPQTPFVEPVKDVNIIAHTNQITAASRTPQGAAKPALRKHSHHIDNNNDVSPPLNPRGASTRKTKGKNHSRQVSQDISAMRIHPSHEDDNNNNNNNNISTDMNQPQIYTETIVHSGSTDVIIPYTNDTTTVTISEVITEYTHDNGDGVNDSNNNNNNDDNDDEDEVSNKKNNNSIIQTRRSARTPVPRQVDSDVDDDAWDEKQKYREKNRLSAQKSRQRKRDLLLKEQNDFIKCKQENQMLRTRIAEMEAKVKYYESLIGNNNNNVRQ